MMELVRPMLESAICGLTATALVDLWSLLRRRLFETALPNYAMVGRWVGHMRSAQFCHAAIARSPAVSGEQLIGWLTHYLTGVGFAAIFLQLAGREWLESPTALPALIFGIVTVAAPWLLMQPGMGAGVAASRTPRPAAARLQSLVTHGIFGAGLFAGGLLTRSLLQGV